MDELLWPELEYDRWRETCQTLHRWTQIVGKIRLSKTPWINHSWHSALYVTERGLTTSVIHDRGRAFSIDFDFVSHSLEIRRSDGEPVVLPLFSESVAAFHDRCLDTLDRLGYEIRIYGRPNELADNLPFHDDRKHCAYDPEYANRFWRALLESDRVMKQFRSLFLGKASPVHFFWGSFDLAASRFSGRRAPEHPGGIPHLPDVITREAYSHEVSSCGFWPGNDRFPNAAFYSYAYPKPEGYENAPMPAESFYHEGLQEFILPYASVRSARAPDQLLLRFFQSAYDAAADSGGWDRELLENSSYLSTLRKIAA